MTAPYDRDAVKKWIRDTIVDTMRDDPGVVREAVWDALNQLGREAAPAKDSRSDTAGFRPHRELYAPERDFLSGWK